MAFGKGFIAKGSFLLSSQILPAGLCAPAGHHNSTLTGGSTMLAAHTRARLPGIDDLVKLSQRG